MNDEDGPHPTQRRSRRRWPAIAALVLVVLALAAVNFMGGPRRTVWWIDRLVVQPTRPPEPADTRAGRWLQDLEYLRTNLYRLHGNAFHTTPRATFERAFEAAREQLADASDADAWLAIMRLIALVGDGHTATGSHLEAWSTVPLRVAHVGGTWSVIAAGPDHLDLLAADLVAMDGVPVVNAVEALRPFVSADSEAHHLARIARLLPLVELTHAAGLQASTERGRFTFRLHGGRVVERELAPAPPSTPLSMVTSGLLLHRDPQVDHWVEWRPDLGAVYLRYRRCRGDTAFAAVAQAALALLDAHDDAPLVVDLRGNPGGASRVIWPLLQGLRERAAGERTVALIDAGTTSSATMNALELRALGATLVGEPTADAQAGWGEVRDFVLPTSGIRVWVSTFRFGGDPEPVEPDLLVRPSATAWLAGEDPVLDTALGR